MTFVAVLVIALALGLGLQSYLWPDGSTTFDRHVTEWFFARRTSHGLTVMTRVSWIGGPVLVIPVAVGTTVALAVGRRWRLALFFATTVTGAALLNALVKAIIDPRRPPGELGLGDSFPSSFPSGHAAVATATYLGLGIVVVVLTRSWPLRVVAWVLAVALILAVCVARVYLLVHWTTDVLVGVTIGTLWVIGTVYGFRWRAPPADPVGGDRA